MRQMRSAVLPNLSDGLGAVPATVPAVPQLGAERRYGLLAGAQTMKAYRLGVHGSVKVPLSDRFWEKVRSFDEEGNDLPGCWEWQGFYNAQSGRPEINTKTVEMEGIQRGPSTKAYRVAWVLHHGPVPPGKIVYRTCQNIRCVRLDHLAVRSPQGPLMLNGRRRYCQRKLNPEMVRRIRATVFSTRRSTGRAEYGIYTRLAAEIGISRQTIIDVVRGRTWRMA